MHRELVKAGLLEPKWGRTFDLLFDRRQAADYLALSSFEREEVELLVAESEQFVRRIKRLLTDS
ncbi:MAG: hypothetical protein WBX15_16895 [Thermoanaerobaculia bacterium]